MLTLVEFAMKFAKKLPRSWLAKIGNSKILSKYVENVRKKGFDNWHQLDNGIKMYFDPTDPHLIDMIDGKDPEKNVKNIFIENISSGDVVIDVGANIGDYTLIACKKVGDSGKVLSFEPLPETFSILKRNIQLNKITNCQHFQKAVGEKPGIANLYKSNASGTMAHLDSSLNGKDLIKKDETDVITIDAMLKSYDIENVNMMKIDVEGFEHEVILGLTKKSGIISFEFTSEFIEDAFKSINYLISLGYSDFNFSIGERRKFYTEWKDAGAIKELIKTVIKEDHLLWGRPVL